MALEALQRRARKEQEKSKKRGRDSPLLDGGATRKGLPSYSSPYGAGWAIDGIDQLVPVAAAPGVAAGMLFVTGAGDSRFFPSDGSGGYTSPAEDFGTLAQNPDGSYTYTAKDQTKEDFNSSGQLTAVVDTHALTLQATCHVEGIPRGQIRGYLPLSYPKRMSGFLYRHRVLLKTFPLSG